MVDDLMMGDGEDPRPELRFGAVEPADVLPRREQHLVDEILGRVAHLSTQVPEQREEQRPEHVLERFGTTWSRWRRGRQGTFETPVRRSHSRSIGRRGPRIEPPSVLPA